MGYIEHWQYSCSDAPPTCLHGNTSKHFSVTAALHPHSPILLPSIMIGVCEWLLSLHMLEEPDINVCWPDLIHLAYNNNAWMNSEWKAVQLTP